MKKIILSIVAFFAIYSATAQSYYQVSASNPLNGNPYYILPKTVILFEVPVTTIAYKAGRDSVLSGLSDDKLRILAKKYGVDPKVYKKLEHVKAYQTSNVDNDSIKVTFMGKADYSKIFFTDGQRNWNKNKSVTFTYGADGVVTDVESSVENKTFDIVVKSLSSIVSIASAAFRGESPNLLRDRDVTYDDLDDILKQLNALGSNMLSEGIYKDIKATLEKRYNKLFANYFYKETKQIAAFKVYYTPKVDTTASSKINTTEVDFFALNTADGSLILSNKFGDDELWAIKKTQGDISKLNPFKFKFTAVTESLQIALKDTKFPADGFAYNIPAKLEFKLIDDKAETVYNDFCKIAQWGDVGRIATNKNKFSSSLDPVTGELKKVTLSSSAITTDQVGNVSTAVSDAVKLARGDSDDTKLENEVKRLDNEVKKRDLLKKLENPQ